MLVETKTKALAILSDVHSYSFVMVLIIVQEHPNT